MPRRTWVPGLSAALLAVVAGCADNPMVLKGRLATYEQEKTNLTRQNEQYQARLTNLNEINLQKETQLGQMLQQNKLQQEELQGLREQLRGMTAQVAQLQTDKETNRAQTASLRRQTGVSFTPNNSFLQTLPTMRNPEVRVRRDGDVIRVELPAHLVFEQGSARLRPGADNLIADAATEIRRSYPEQLIGIEGHTDTDPVSGGPYRTNHELAVARAVAVYDILVGSGRYRADQVFVAGQGPNRPVVSNGTPEGKQRNRRVELVVFPEKRGQ